jgi:hypothetical protein
MSCLGALSEFSHLFKMNEITRRFFSASENEITVEIEKNTLASESYFRNCVFNNGE